MAPRGAPLGGGGLADVVIVAVIVAVIVTVIVAVHVNGNATVIVIGPS